MCGRSRWCARRRVRGRRHADEDLPAAETVSDRGHEFRLPNVAILIGVGEGSLAMCLKKIAAGAAMVGALGFSAVGLGAGIASAAPPAPVVAGILWQQDRGHGGDWGHGD